MGLLKSWLLRCLLGFGLLFMSVDGALFADTCNPGQYMVCNLDLQYGSECNDCECAQCPPGQTSDGTGLVTYCPNQYGDSGCYVPENLCLGYNDCPDGYGIDNKKCRTIDGACPNGCNKYESCDPVNGAIGVIVTGNCHLENDICYSNTRACSMFEVDHFAVGWNCDQWVQVGNAEWRPSENAWDTKNCTCSVVDRDIVHDVGGVAAYDHCIAANSDFYVTEADRYRTTSVNDHVRYSFRRQFCRQCEPGYLPKIENAQVNGVYSRPDDNGNWGVITCGIQVQAPDYADGCVIEFNLSTGNDAQNACRKQCPDGFATESDGATSVTYCQYDGHTTYTDGTGTFYIGSLDDCP